MSRSLALSLVVVCLTLARADTLTAAPPQALTATEVLDRSLDALGGFERFARLRGARIERTLAFLPAGAGPPLRTVQTARFPHTMWMEVDRAEGADSLLEYDAHRVSAGPSADEMTAADEGTRDWLRGFYWREWWILYGRYAWHGLGEVWLEASPPVVTSEDVEYVVAVEPRDAAPYRLVVDGRTWRPLRREFRSGDRDVVDVYSDYRESDGILFPMRIDSYVDGERAEEIVYSEVAFELDEEPPTLARRLDAILEASVDEKGIPGLVTWMAQGDEVLLHSARGEESVELDLPMRLDSSLPLASVSKLFAGVAAMRLVERGELDLDAPVARYLPAAEERHPDLTTRHLLTHTSGLRELFPDRPGPVRAPSAAEVDARDDWLAEAVTGPADSPPGSTWRYSATGYLVLQAVLEAASGIDYPGLAAREIFEPLDLTSPVFGGSDRIVPGRLAMDYVWIDGVLSYNYLDYPPSTWTAAGLNATAADVAALYRGVVDGRLLTAASREELWRETVLPDGEETAYALGWGSFRTSRDGRWSVGHSGGGSSWTRYFPDLDLTVVVLGNLNGAREDKLVHDLATAVAQAEVHGWP